MPIKILSVDDEVDLEVLLTQYFRRKIRKGEYEFYFAHNGIEGLKQLLLHPDIDIILSDINMPEMDGLTMLAKVNEMRNPALKVIMVSAYGDMENIRTAMNNGAFDFATKPIDLDDLQKSIDNAVEQIKFIRESQREHEQLKDIQSDLRIASEIQHAILPTNKDVLPKDLYDMASLMDPAKDVGGDFYDYFKTDEDRLGFVMADVSGKGVPAALFMAVSRTLLKATGIRDLVSKDCMTSVNDLVCGESVDGMFVTVFYGRLNIKTGEIDYSNAGHNPPYVVHENGKVEMVPAQGNMVLGAVENFQYRNDKITLEKGDMLFTFTDGVTEAMNRDGEQFGEERLEKLLAKCGGKTSQETIDTVRAAVAEWAGETEQSDDVTMLVIKRK
ncbi:MAG: SpoIIE family protein phosphatase [Bacteroidaceae bacterium]|nr:SpoIIE family protein phosphatase [Bacteroidaceae bacterium]